MSRRMAVVAAAIIAGVVAGCGPATVDGSATTSAAPATGSTAAPTTSQAVTPAVTTPSSPTSGVPAALRRFYGQRLRWRPCGATTFSCATLTVPEDYAHPGGATLHVAVIRDQTVAHPIGSLIVNPGGPGGSGVGFVRDDAAAFTAELQHFSLVSFDPRGVGQSDPVRCVPPAFLDRYLDEPPVPTSAGALHAFEREARRFASGCRRRDGSLLAHVGTIDAARDMDVLRAALGDAQLTYYGASYGTYLGAKYAQLFPGRIRAMILDGAVDPAQSTLAADRQQAVGFETDLHDFLRAWIAEGDSPFGSTVPAAVEGLHQLFTQVSAHPLTVGTRTLGPGEFFNGLAAGFYDSADWPQLRTALTQVRDGSGSLLLAFADSLSERRPDGSFSNLIESNIAINCIDRPAPRSPAAYARAARAASATAPFFGPAIAWSSLPCAYWPVRPVEQAHAVHAPTAAHPILVVGTSHDPATPYQQAVDLTRQLGQARLLTLDGDGHTALLRGDSCIDDAGLRYLVSLTLPAAGTTCH